MIKINDLPQCEMMALMAAKEIQQNAYAPYSNYKVGVAVVSVSGRIYTGVNVENCVYVVSHAEVLALGEMAKQRERRFVVLAEVSPNGGIPCLLCRQYMREFSGEDLSRVIVLGMKEKNMKDIVRCTFADLVGVDSFGPRVLGINPSAH